MDNPRVSDTDLPDVSGSNGGASDAQIRTFLIADVRGYTLFTQERGDEVAAKLAAKFADIAREIVEGRGGTPLELRGAAARSSGSAGKTSTLRGGSFGSRTHCNRSEMSSPSSIRRRRGHVGRSSFRTERWRCFGVCDATRLSAAYCSARPGSTSAWSLNGETAGRSS